MPVVMVGRAIALDDDRDPCRWSWAVRHGPGWDRPLRSKERTKRMIGN